MAEQPASDVVFSGSIPQIYEEHFVPMMFQPYADDVARRVVELAPRSVLEIAAGTGVVTRAMASTLPADVTITATDLNQPMLDHAAALGTARAVEWRQADAMALPFDDESFDVVVCQFGVMFFPDRRHGYAEMHRVLRPGGTALVSMWDRIERNEIPHVIQGALSTMFPDDPPLFMSRTPHGYHDVAEIAEDAAAGGFEHVTIDSLEMRSRAPSAAVAAIAECQGTPWRNEIEERGPGRLQEATDRSAAALAARFGDGEIEGRIAAFVVTARKD